MSDYELLKSLKGFVKGLIKEEFGSVDAATLKNVHQRLAEIERRLAANRVGLDNVYKEFIKIPKTDKPIEMIEWHKLADKTPRTLQMVYVTNSASQDIAVAVWHGNNWMSGGWTFHNTKKEFLVTHWMRIPDCK